MSVHTRLLFRCLVIIIRMLRVLIVAPDNQDAKKGVDEDARAIVSELLKAVNTKVNQ